MNNSLLCVLYAEFRIKYHIIIILYHIIIILYHIIIIFPVLIQIFFHTWEGFSQRDHFYNILVLCRPIL